MQEIYKRTIKLFKELHAHPEISDCEFTTKRILIDFIKNNTSCEVVDRGKWFYAYRKAQVETNDNIAFRADFDAVSLDDEHIGHYCGHDGHSATLAGFLVLIEKLTLSKNIYAIFQHAEETGKGAYECSELIEEANIKEIYAYHNIPGYKLADVLIKYDTFACASVGMSIKFNGAISHAAYPSSGKNPSFALAKLIETIENDNNTYKPYIEFCTIVGVKMGSDNFGISPGEAILNLTIRSEKEMSLRQLIDKIKNTAIDLANEYGLTLDFEYIEPFPETLNDNFLIDNLIDISNKNKISYQLLDKPMHWSEDFGYYLKKTRGVLLGIGDGLDTGDLHTINYYFDNKIFLIVWRLYLEIISR